MRIEVHIDRLVVDDQVSCSSDQIIAALAAQLRPALARDLGRPAAASAGRAIGAAVAGTVTAPRALPGPRRER